MVVYLFMFLSFQMTTEDMAKADIPGADIMAIMFEFFQTQPERDIDLTRKLNPNIVSFEDWVEKNKDVFAALE